jgi:hypothetical protein
MKFKLVKFDFGDIPKKYHKEYPNFIELTEEL